MAGIDKIYLTADDYFEFKQWIWKKTFIIILLTWYNPCGYFYDIPEEAFETGFGQKEYPATNFPRIIDQFLFLHCRFPYIQKRLKEQYGSVWSCLAPIWVIKLIDNLKTK